MIIANAFSEGVQNILSYLNQATEVFGPLGKYIAALVIFLIGKWLAGKVRNLAEAGLAKTGVDDKVAKYLGGNAANSEKFFGLLLYAVLMIFVIMMALERIELTQVTDPLRDMMSTVMAYLPKIIGAGIFLYIGVFFAKLVKQLLENVLRAAKLDERIGKHTETSLTPAISNGVFWFILLMIIPAALGILEIKQLEEPISGIVSQVTSSIPNILTAGVLVAIGFLIARIARNLVESLLNGVGADQWGQKLGIASPTAGSRSLSSIVGLIVMVSIMVLIFTQAVAALKLPLLATASAGFLGGYFRVLLALLILGGGLIAANFAYRNIVGKNAGLAKVVKYLIIAMAAIGALSQSGIAPEFIRYATIALATVLGVGGAIALGLGGREYVARKLEKLP